MDHNEAETLARTMIADHLDGWTFKWDRAKKRFGCCHYQDKTISLSWYLVGLNSEHDVTDVILHEIAHALAGFKAGHKLEWKLVARAIGCTSNRCYGDHVAQPKAKWVGECGCGKTILRQRRNRGLFHTICQTSFVWRLNGD